MFSGCAVQCVYSLAPPRFVSDWVTLDSVSGPMEHTFTHGLSELPAKVEVQVCWYLILHVFSHLLCEKRNKLNWVSN